MEDLKTEIEQIKVQLFTGIKLGRIEKEWGEMIIGTCDRALTIPVVVGQSEQLVCYKKCGKTEPYNDICLNCGSSINYDAN